MYSTAASATPIAAFCPYEDRQVHVSKPGARTTEQVLCVQGLDLDQPVFTKSHTDEIQIELLKRVLSDYDERTGDPTKQYLANKMIWTGQQWILPKFGCYDTSDDPRYLVTYQTKDSHVSLYKESRRELSVDCKRGKFKFPPSPIKASPLNILAKLYALVFMGCDFGNATRRWFSVKITNRDTANWVRDALEVIEGPRAGDDSMFRFFVDGSDYGSYYSVKLAPLFETKFRDEADDIIRRYRNLFYADPDGSRHRGIKVPDDMYKVDDNAKRLFMDTLIENYRTTTGDVSIPYFIAKTTITAASLYYMAHLTGYNFLRIIPIRIRQDMAYKVVFEQTTLGRAARHHSLEPFYKFRRDDRTAPRARRIVYPLVDCPIMTGIGPCVALFVPPGNSEHNGSDD